MTTQAVFFDLDGTLADTALDLGEALNQVLAQQGLPCCDMQAIRQVASHGAAGLLQLGMNITPSHPDYNDYRTRYLNEYERCLGKQTVLFSGINQLIIALHHHHIPWGIITNKPTRFTEQLIPFLHFAIPPAIVVCGDTVSEAKPSPLPMLYACERINVLPEKCLYVGDAERDMQAGNRVGMKTLLVEWGYFGSDDNIQAWQADAIIQHPMDILKYLSTSY